MKAVWRYLKEHIVLCVAIAAAAITCCFVPPDRGYLGYFDLRTLTCLFLTLAVICALRHIHFFTILARRIVMFTGNLRTLSLALVYITFIGSMLIANDMALITFLPLGYFALTSTNNKRYMAYVFILQNVSANLGGMLTPFGNPQNLYLYSFFKIPTGEFTSIMLPPFLLAVAMLTAACFFLPRSPLSITDKFHTPLDKPRAALYLALFAFSLLIVFRVIPYYIGLVAIPLVLWFADKNALKEVDYSLLLTFAFFFLFAGNLARVPAINAFFAELLKKSTLLVSILSCQVISNVPSAILLSQFTDNYKELLLGVNIGGTGTLIASLASLITYSEYAMFDPKGKKTYLLLFAAVNAVFLGVMTAATAFWFV